jgi:hypothetical protein
VNEANIELAPDYGLDSGHTSLFQAGAYFSAIFKREIFKMLVTRKAGPVFQLPG